MPATFTRTPPQKKPNEPGIGGHPPLDRRPTGGGDDGGGDDRWRNEHHGPRERLLRVRFFVLFAVAADIIFFGVLAAIYFARVASEDPSAHSYAHGGWHGSIVSPVLYLGTACLILSSVTMEMARRNIFREIDVMEEWLGLGRPALKRALPWLGATLVLGLLFLAGQWMAWRQAAAQGLVMNASVSAAGFLFYLLTGIYAAHLLLGVAALIVCLSSLGWLKRVEYRQIAVDSTAWYWQAMVLAWTLLLGVLSLGQ